MKKLSALLLGFILLLCSCASVEDASVSGAISPLLEAAPQPCPIHEPPPHPEEVPPSYVGGLAKSLAEELSLESADGETAIRAAYKYMVENIYFGEPAGLHVWRYFSDDETIPYLENRSISPFLFKIGSCEDFAAATVMLLEAAGFEAKYVAGYTLSADMVYVDHAWVLVKLDGEWYHLDPQLEQNVMRNNLLTYRYYLKSDGDMQTDHKWGENLIAYWDDITDEEKDNIRKNHTPPPCPASYARPEAESLPKQQKPDIAAIEEKINALAAQSGKDEPPRTDLNVEPPVLTRAHHVTPPLMPKLPYGRMFLKGDAARLYDFFITQLHQTDAECPVPPSLSNSEALFVVAALQSDHPEYDWAEFSVITEGGWRFIRYSVRQGLTPEQAAAHRSEPFNKARAIFTGIPEGASEFEKALYIHDYLAGTLQYDTTVKSENSGNIYGALVENLAYCDGFAKSFHFLCREAGLYSVYIKGASSRGVEHAWNAVSIDGLWYYVDVTWDRPLRPGDGVYHDYFLISLDEMADGHIPMAGQYPELPPSPSGQPGYYERLGYFVKDEEDLTSALASAFYKQLEAAEIPPLVPEPVFLEVKALGGHENYLRVKEHYLKNVFNILKHIDVIFVERGKNFQIPAEESVRCDFNDSTRVLTFYPRVRRMYE